MELRKKVYIIFFWFLINYCRYFYKTNYALFTLFFVNNFCIILFIYFNLRAKLNPYLLIVVLLGSIIHFTITELWSYRNFKETGIKEFTYLKVQNDYLYKTAGIIAKKENRKFIDVQEEFRKKTINLSRQEFIKLSNNEIKNAIFNYPLQTIMVGLEGVLMTFLTPGTGQYPRMLNIKDSNYKLSKNLFNGIGFIWIIMMGLFALYGLLKIDKEILFLLFVLIFIYLILATSGPGSYSRFRIPFMPLIIVLISSGYKNFLYLFKKKL